MPVITIEGGRIRSDDVSPRYLCGFCRAHVRTVRVDGREIIADLLGEPMRGPGEPVFWVRHRCKQSMGGADAKTL